MNTAAHRGLRKNCEVAAEQFRRYMFKKCGFFKNYMLPEYEWDDNLTVFGGGKIPKLQFKGKIAVQAHIFYPELAEEIALNANCIPCDFDIYASTDSEQKAALIRETLQKKCKAKKIAVEVFENKGRDVLPFLKQLRPVIGAYDLFCHIHSKRTMSDENFRYGEAWRQYLYRHLFGTKGNVVQILNVFAQEKKCAMVFPETYPIAETGVYGLACKFPHFRELARRWGVKLNKLDVIKDYSPGTMFWARTEPFKNFIQDDWHYKFFKSECGAENFAFEHSVERIWPYLALPRGWTIRRTFNNTEPPAKIASKKRLAFFACGEKLCQSDKDYFSALKELGCQTIAAKRAGGQDSLCAFRDALSAFGFGKLKKYDQVVLADDSCLAPIFPLETLFKKMQDGKKDFWGVTILPQEQKQDERVQSYFMVFEKRVLKDSLFEEFWRGGDLTEAALNEFFKKKFSYDTCFFEYAASKDFLRGQMDCATYRPQQLLLLGCPLIKKEVALSPKGKEQLHNLLVKFSSKKYYAEF